MEKAATAHITYSVLTLQNRCQINQEKNQRWEAGICARKGALTQCRGGLLTGTVVRYTALQPGPR